MSKRDNSPTRERKVVTRHLFGGTRDIFAEAKKCLIKQYRRSFRQRMRHEISEELKNSISFADVDADVEREWAFDRAYDDYALSLCPDVDDLYLSGYASYEHRTLSTPGPRDYFAFDDLDF